VNLLVVRGASLSIFEASAAGDRASSGCPRQCERRGGAPGVNDRSADGGRRRTGSISVIRRSPSCRSRTRPTSRAIARRHRNTPLQCCARWNGKFVAALLIGHGADVNAADAQAGARCTRCREQHGRGEVS
jgi:hypothetical protein